jgi:hypothetical protein
MRWRLGAAQIEPVNRGALLRLSRAAPCTRSEPVASMKLSSAEMKIRTPKEAPSSSGQPSWQAPSVYSILPPPNSSLATGGLGKDCGWVRRDRNVWIDPAPVGAAVRCRDQDGSATRSEVGTRRRAIARVGSEAGCVRLVAAGVRDAGRQEQAPPKSPKETCRHDPLASSPIDEMSRSERGTSESAWAARVIIAR